MSKQIWTVTRRWESGFGPTEKDIVGVYANGELAYAAILRHIIAEHQKALDDLEPDGSDPDYMCSQMHGGDYVRFILEVWNINSGTSEHKGTYR